MTKEELGGWRSIPKGLVDNLAENEEHAFQMMRTFLSYLPQNVWEPPIALLRSTLDIGERRRF